MLGVFAQEALDLVAATLLELGVKRAFVVHGSGLDEISLAGETLITEVRDGCIRSFIVTPEEFGVAPAPLEALRAELLTKMPPSSGEFSRASPALAATSL